MKTLRAVLLCVLSFLFGWWLSREVEPLTAVQQANAECLAKGSRLQAMALYVVDYDANEAYMSVVCESDMEP